MKNTIIVNLFSGPGAGKSTTAAGIFYYLKRAGINCEMAREYAKNVVWKEAYTVLHDQNYIFAKQSNILHFLNHKVDVIITDSPLLLSLIYGNDTDTGSYFKEHVIYTFNKYNNVNIFLNREKKYNPARYSINPILIPR